MKITVYTDGGCLNNDAPSADKANGTVVCFGAYSAILLDNDLVIKELSGVYEGVTNNQMELTGAIVGLRTALGLSDSALLITDSNYVARGIQMLPEYAANGWRTRKGKPLANLDLWREMWRAIKGRNVSVELVAGHSGDYWNTRCDRLCTAALAPFR